MRRQSSLGFSAGSAAALVAALLSGTGTAAAAAQRPAHARAVTQARPRPGAPAAAGGAWGNAADVPGIAALDQGGDASLTDVSCSATGNCGAIGTFLTPGSSDSLPFVVSQVNGVWGNAQAVPGLAALSPLGGS